MFIIGSAAAKIRLSLFGSVNAGERGVSPTAQPMNRRHYYEKFSFQENLRFYADGSSAGNPCACVYLKNSGEITHPEMQQIAAELKGFVNEVVYLFPEDKTSFLKYYSAECEVDFCGHGTIGVMYDLIKNHHNLMNQRIIEIRVKDTN